ncbi:lipid-A-disaccharide synthase [Pseudooctadecabacter jejudonensis]|uniref:Lipid-A-disaccharide synthase n=1 Tax=Pseudooctadecabacter jejudonensis TaxID=1391910 RepID=A0A1Y5RGT1_9RHOB|nr:lipid-A-disaccharide synthase [Pseudooctadecabacter jejudonensis]SLN16855.1 Lipid-A-disaccharide synthase [Pseudooctadecabacter jejudonensis]
MKAFVIAGEPSGDKLGAAVMAGMRAEVMQVHFDGIGGPLMEGQGLRSLFPMQELSLMGIAEILPKYRHLKRRIRETAEAVIAAKPDVLITIDSPDFCLRVARLVKAASDIRTVHYVAPTVWAWRAGRAAKMAQVIDHVLALFPFEPPYMQEAGMDCDFVGHPVTAEPAITPDELAAFRTKVGLTEDRGTLVVLPGSRRGEVERLSARFSDAIAQADLGEVQIVIPTLTHLRDTVEAMFAPVLKGAAYGVVVSGDGETPEHAARDRLVAMAAGDLALAASGTVSLELAFARTPMVIAYDMNWLSRQIISRMLLTDTVTLVNLVSETRIVPEFIGQNCEAGPIARALKGVMAAPEDQLAALNLTMERLGQGGDAPGLRAARAILARMP